MNRIYRIKFTGCNPAGIFPVEPVALAACVNLGPLLNPATDEARGYGFIVPTILRNKTVGTSGRGSAFQCNSNDLSGTVR